MTAAPLDRYLRRLPADTSTAAVNNPAADSLVMYDILLAFVKAGSPVYQPTQFVQGDDIYRIQTRYEPYEYLFVMNPSMAPKFEETCREQNITPILLKEWMEAEKEKFLHGRNIRPT